MSDWVVHFVHDRRTENDPNWIFGEGEEIQFPFTVDDKKNKRFDHWYWMDEEYPIEPDASAIQVIQKILHDGHIRAGWSFRGGRATIYGPRAACCFTEMPLHALIEYAKTRDDPQSVTPYGICLMKRELFRSGGRPAIYGLSGAYKEEHVHEWARFLEERCGIGETEQYRFVSFNLGDGKFSDWTHEREWRWCDHGDQHWCPGLPIWLAEEPRFFSTVLIIVSREEECESLLDTIKEFHDAGGNNYDVRYNQALLAETRVVSLESLARIPSRNLRVLKLEDIPTHQLRKFKKPVPSAPFLRALTRAIEEASIAALAAAENYRRTAPRTKDGHIRDGFGFATLMLDSPQSDLTEALLRLKVAKPIGGVGYRLPRFTGESRTGLLGEQEAAAEAAKEVLERYYPDALFYIRARWD